MATTSLLLQVLSWNLSGWLRRLDAITDRDFSLGCGAMSDTSGTRVSRKFGHSLV